MHDTPPPTLFSDGSLAVELRDIFISSTRIDSKFLYITRPADAEPPYIAHIRVLHGNGDMLYQDLYAEHSVIKIELRDDTGAVANVTISGDNEGFKIDSDGELADSGPGAKGRQKYKHSGTGNSFYISRITVEKPADSPHFQVNSRTKKEEYRVLIWHEGDTHTAL